MLATLAVLSTKSAENVNMPLNANGAWRQFLYSILKYATNSKGTIIYVIWLDKVSKMSALYDISILFTYVLGPGY